MKIKKFIGEINNVVDLSPTAKEIKITTSEPVDFIAGSFLNVFMNINGERIRRAFSISSSILNQEEITLAIRFSPTGKMSPLFWQKDMIGEKLELMGPLGLNTVDKMKQDKIYLFAFGIGAGVVKSIADYFIQQKNKNIFIFTGSKYENEIIYRDYFDNLQKNYENVKVQHIVSRSVENKNIKIGYIQGHIDEFDFNDSDIYVCGQEKACEELVNKIKEKKSKRCEFFIEGFH